MLLSAAGLTRGRPVITHHDAHADLAAAGAQVITGARVVDDGDLLTGAGITSGLDLGLWIVEREAGAAIAARVARQMEYQRSPAIWTRDHPVLTLPLLTSAGSSNHQPGGCLAG
jgi:transcriptional regulator GlxA family with amidase domain